MEKSICTNCKIGKNCEDFFNKYTESKICNSNRSLKRYHENKNKLSTQKNYIMKKVEKNYYKNKTVDI